MNKLNFLLHDFDAYIRSVVKESMAEVLPTLSQNTQSPKNRIGGIELFAEVTGLARQTGYNLVSKKAVPHYKRGGKLLFSEEELRKWLLEHPQITSDKSYHLAHQNVILRRKKKGGAK